MGHIVVDQPNVLQPVADLAKQLGDQITQRRQQRQQQELALRQYVMETGLPVEEADIRRLAPLVDVPTFMATQERWKKTGVLSKQERKTRVEEAQIAGAEAQTEMVRRQTKAIGEQLELSARQLGLNEQQFEVYKKATLDGLAEQIRHSKEMESQGRAGMWQQKELTEAQIDAQFKIAQFNAAVQVYTTDKTIGAQLATAGEAKQLEFVEAMTGMANDAMQTFAKLGTDSWQEAYDKFPYGVQIIKNAHFALGRMMGIDDRTLEAQFQGLERPSAFGKVVEGFGKSVMGGRSMPENPALQQAPSLAQPAPAPATSAAPTQPLRPSPLAAQMGGQGNMPLSPGLGVAIAPPPTPAPIDQYGLGPGVLPNINLAASSTTPAQGMGQFYVMNPYDVRKIADIIGMNTPRGK